MTSTATQWSAYYEDLWQPELMKYLRARYSYSGSRYADQRSLLKKRDLPTFAVSIAAEEVTDADFETCFKFLTASTAQVLSVEQQQLLARLNAGLEPQQITVEIGVQFTDSRVTDELIEALGRLFQRVEVTDREDPIRFPVKLQVTTLWFGLNAFAVPGNIGVLKDLKAMSGVCVRHTLSNLSDAAQRQWTQPLQYYSPNMLLDPSVRRLDLRL